MKKPERIVVDAWALRHEGEVVTDGVFVLVCKTKRAARVALYGDEKVVKCRVTYEVEP